MFNEQFEDNPFTFDVTDKAQTGQIVQLTIDAVDQLGAHEFDKAGQTVADIFEHGPDAVYVSCLAIAGATRKFALLANGLTEFPAGSFTIVTPPPDMDETSPEFLSKQFAARFVAAYLNDDLETCEALFGALLGSQDMKAIDEAYTVMMENAHVLMHRAFDADPSSGVFEPVLDPFVSGDGSNGSSSN